MENSVVKQKSTLVKDALALFLITLISGLALSFIFEITKEPIETQRKEKQIQAYKQVYSEGNFSETMEPDADLMQKASEVVLTEINPSYVGVTIDEVIPTFDNNGGQIGYVIKVTTTESYKDKISLAIGYSNEGVIKGLEILAISETAGLGMNATKPEFKNQFANKTVSQFVVTKSGATNDNEIDALSSATITSKAITNAVNAGIAFLNEYAVVIGGGTIE